jgi:predicted ATPase
MVVLTGGPCAGKTTVFRRVEALLGNQVTLVPEVATMLLSSGYPMPGRDLEWSEEWRDSFQRAIAAVQLEVEEAYALRARAQGHRLLLTDRGLMDGAAYHTSIEEFLGATGLNHRAALTRYQAVVHLESVAIAQPDLYSKGNNPFRFETLEEAIPLEAKTRAAWFGHKRHTILEGVDLDYKVEETIKVLQGCLLK